jgi:hypothetical protein
MRKNAIAKTFRVRGEKASAGAAQCLFELRDDVAASTLHCQQRADRCDEPVAEVQNRHPPDPEM